MMTMKVHFIVGINGDRVEVSIDDVFSQEYAYGYNVSHNRAFARIAEKDVENAKKYGWKSSYCLKPFIGDVLDEIKEKYKPEKIEYSGYYVFSNQPMTDDEVRKKIERIELESMK